MSKELWKPSKTAEKPGIWTDEWTTIQTGQSRIIRTWDWGAIKNDGILIHVA